MIPTWLGCVRTFLMMNSPYLGINCFALTEVVVVVVVVVGLVYLLHFIHLYIVHLTHQMYFFLVLC